MSAPAGTRRPSVVERFVDACRRHPVTVDAVLAVVVALIGVALARSAYSPRAQWDSSTVVAILAAAPIVWRRRYPLPAAIVAAVVGVVALPITGVRGLELPALIMGYSVVAYGPRWAGPATLGVMMVGSLLPAVRNGLPDDLLVLVFLLVVAALFGTSTWLAGSLRRAQLTSVERLRERARLLEEGRRQEVRLELLAERSRISREVHDVVAHSLSGIIAQADGGQYAATRDPQRAVEVLAGIATTGREALGDVRGLLSMLRDTAPVDDPDDASRPQPGTDDVPALVEQVRAGGLSVDLEVTGSPRPLTSGAGLTAYRVVQESLTNVIKHAGTTAVTHVSLHWTDDELTVRVRDEGARGPRPTPPAGGHGLTGMRERAALHGGSVETGAHPDGGFVVRLRLPLTPGT
ncbi:signal transduction histidine kinase [Pseudonocardia sediminis]|uniref:histidine kinase n=1 Tax=Pseudonocardia sediminis TaxID=1397368 RepID=A0A4Q7UXS5_PSEST|nr:sensor histidine kinase [Pseudonocardia sediminis]RZT85858.1 signal transduction histidine kinase [Pseudonocardia sediminis]